MGDEAENMAAGCIGCVFLIGMAAMGGLILMVWGLVEAFS